MLEKKLGLDMARSKNIREKLVEDMATEQGWGVLGRGWPDFLLYNRRTKEAIFLEVKSCRDGLNKYQRRVHKILKGLGLDVRTVRVGRNTGEKSAARRIVAKAITK